MWTCSQLMMVSFCVQLLLPAAPTTGHTLGRRDVAPPRRVCARSAWSPVFSLAEGQHFTPPPPQQQQHAHALPLNTKASDTCRRPPPQCGCCATLRQHHCQRAACATAATPAAASHPPGSWQQQQRQVVGGAVAAAALQLQSRRTKRQRQQQAMPSSALCPAPQMPPLSCSSRCGQRWRQPRQTSPSNNNSRDRHRPEAGSSQTSGAGVPCTRAAGSSKRHSKSAGSNSSRSRRRCCFRVARASQPLPLPPAGPAPQQ